MKVAIIGLGVVGLSFASVLGSKGFSVFGIDSDVKKIGNISFGVSFVIGSILVPMPAAVKTALIN